VEERPVSNTVTIVPVATTKPQRRAPRKLDGKWLVKIRITAHSEADAEQARALIEELLSSVQCRMQTPHQGSNPKYADDPKWMSYGDFVLPAKTKRGSRK